MTSYIRTMREAREEMLQSLNESNLEKMRKASKGAKQTLKMKDGSIGMDSFTASAIMQIYDKVNDKNKKTMENLLKDGRKADIVKLMKFAMSKVNAEYVPEDMTVTASTDGGISQRDLDYVQKELRKLGIRDAVVDQNEMDRNKIDVKTRMSDDKVKRAFDKSKMTVNYEHVELDEDIMPVIFGGGIIAGLLPILYLSAKEIAGPSIGKLVDKLKKNKNYKMSDSEKSDVKGFVSKVKKDKPSLLQKAMKKIKEEVELDESQEQIKQLEKMLKDLEKKKKKTPGDGYAKMKIKELLTDLKSKKEEVELDEKLDKEDEPKVKEIIKKLKGASQAHAGQAKDLQKAVTEKDELDEAEAYSPKQIKMAIGIASDPRYKGGNYSGAVKAIEKIKGGLSQHKQVAAVLKRQNEALGENLDGRTREYRQHRERLESLRSKRLEARHIDPADIDTSATDDDIKSADKNIMMQLRKSVSLRGQYSVEFLDKKKVKVPQKIALAVIAKYNSLKKPMDKEKFQAKVAKSHRDLLMGLKENLDEKKKKDKIKIGEESTLDRMNKKLQEKKNG